MTTGEKLLSMSTLVSGSAMDHFTHISGGAGETLCGEFSAGIETRELDAGIETRVIGIDISSPGEVRVDFAGREISIEYKNRELEWDQCMA